jgi:putative SOS response-associated peptidase YedK
MVEAVFDPTHRVPLHRGRHCLVLADGYYEWKTVVDRKQPYRITLKTGEPFAMARIYAREPTEFDTPEKNPVNFAILTTKANEVVSHIQDRMPQPRYLQRPRSHLPPRTGDHLIQSHHFGSSGIR